MTAAASSTPRTIPATMTAVVQPAYGDAEVLHVEETAVPTIGAGEVLVRVAAAGMDRGTWHSMTGRPYLMRVLGFGLRRPKNPVPGLDVAGSVVAIGAEVTRFAVGDVVFGASRGSFAEYAAAREDKLARVPAGLSPEQAAVLGISGMTAVQAVETAGRVAPGQRVLVIGASGGVGSFAVQVAKAAGAEVTGVSSTAKTDLVRALGADHVLDYTRDDVTDGTRTYDLVIDIGGNRRLSRLRRALTPTGTLVVVGGEDGGSVTGGFGRSLRAVALSPFVHQRLTMVAAKEHHEFLDRLVELVEAGALTPAIDSTVTLEQVPDAMRRLEQGQVRGKVAVRVAASV